MRVEFAWFGFVMATVCAGPALADAPAKVTPLPGIDVVAPMKPDWCGSYTRSISDNDLAPRVNLVASYFDSGEIPEKALRQLAQLACERPDDPAMQQRVAGWRQTYLNATGARDADDRAALKLRIDERRFEAQKRELCAKLEPSPEASAGERVLARARKLAFACVDRADVDGLGWWIDRGSEVDEVLRAVWVSHCLRFRFANSKDAWPEPMHPENQARFATCGVDGRRLDRSKLDALLAGSTYNDYARVIGRETWSQAKATYAQLEQVYKQMATKDEAMKRLLFDAGEAGFSGWEKDYAAHKDAFDAALAFEDKARGPSKKAMKDCGPTLRKHVVDYVKAKKPQSREDVRNAMTDDIGYVLIGSLILCDAAEGRLVTSAQEYEALRRNAKGDEVHPRESRGPRLAAYNAVVSALADIVTDRARFPIPASKFIALEQPPTESDGDTLTHMAYNLWANKSNATEDEWGEVATVKKTPTGVVITFKTISWMADTWDCHFTNRIWRIGPNGEVEYEQSCKVTGKHKESKTEHSVVIAPEVADGIKVGTFGHFKADSINVAGDAPRPAFPIEVYTTKDKKKLVVGLGVAL